MEFQIGFIELASRFLLALLFLISGVSKLSNLMSSKKSLQRFGIKGEKTSSFFGIALPLFELLIAILLITDMNPIGYVLSSVLLLIFLPVLGYNIWVGNDSPCGCFGDISNSKLDKISIYRTGSFFFGSFMLIGNPLVHSELIYVIAFVSLLLGWIFSIYEIVIKDDYSILNEHSADQVSRKSFIKVMTSLIAGFGAAFLVPKSVLAATCTCQQYDHFEAASCCDVYHEKTIHHYFKRCCYGAVLGPWRKFRPDACTYECACGTPTGGCSVLGSCSGGCCYPADCGLLD